MIKEKIFWDKDIKKEFFEELSKFPKEYQRRIKNFALYFRNKWIEEWKELNKFANKPFPLK